MGWLKKEWRLVLLGLFLLGNVFVWYAVYKEAPSKYLTVAFLNIGQGDAIYIESPTHNRIMVDGGPPRAVMSELEKVMPFYIRYFDTLIVTNPSVHQGVFRPICDWAERCQRYARSCRVQPL